MSARVRWRVAEQEEEQDAVGAEEGVHGVAVQHAVDHSRAARDLARWHPTTFVGS
jgi:hypothetical protein